MFKTLDRYLVALLCLFVLGRLVLALFLDVYPDHRFLLEHWQYLGTDLLREDLLRSLFYLHAQPPLWNLLVGSLLKVSGGDLQRFETIYLILSVSLSALTLLMLYGTIYLISSSRRLAFGGGFFYMVFSASAYYENYVFYSLFSTFLLILVVYSAARFLVAGTFSIRWFALTNIALAALSLTWSLFHPILLILVCAALLYMKPVRMTGARWIVTKACAAFGICLIVAISPSIKNYLLFGIFSNGSWLGLNLAQAAPESPEYDDMIADCEFQPIDDYRGVSIPAASPYDHASLTELEKSDGETNFNHYGYISVSKHCLGISKAAILEHPIMYIRSVGLGFVRSSLRLSDDYPLAGPKNWTTVEPLRRFTNMVYIPVEFTFRNKKFIGYALPLLATLVISTLAIGIVIRRPNQAGLMIEVFLVCALLIVFVMSVGHLANGSEQHRMRFTLEPLYIISIASILKMLMDNLRARVQRRPVAVS